MFSLFDWFPEGLQFVAACVSGYLLFSRADLLSVAYSLFGMSFWPSAGASICSLTILCEGLGVCSEA